MPVSIEDFQKELDNPDFQKAVRDALAQKEYVVRTKDEENEFHNRFRTDVIEKEIPKQIRDVHGQYDKDIKELYGIDRLHDEKTYDYLKRAARLKLSEYDNLKSEVLTLKEQIKSGDPTGSLRRQLEEVETRARVALEEKENVIKSLTNEKNTIEKSASVNTIYAGIKLQFKKDLPPLFNRTEKALLDDVIANSVLKDGKLYITNLDGSIKKDSAFKEVTVEDYLKNEFKDFFASNTTSNGSGSKNFARDIDPNAINSDNFPMRENLKTKDELMAYMLELGLKRGTEVFDKIWAKYAQGLKLA